jgi:hypothetical protein
VKPPRTVAIDLYARRAYPFMDGIVLAVPGLIVEDEASGVRVRVLENGSLEEIGAVPARKSVASDPTAGRAP